MTKTKLTLSNEYGSLHLIKEDGKYFVVLENYTTYESDFKKLDWTRISKELYDLMIKELSKENAQ